MTSTVEDLDRRTTGLERAQGETTETLRWVVTKLARVQAVQDEHTLRLDRVESKVDKLEAKVEALPRVMAEMIAASEERLTALVEASEKRLTGLIESSEKRLTDLVESSEKRTKAASTELIETSERRLMAAIAGRA